MNEYQKFTYRASPDVALVKYWGKKDPVLRLPENNSISLILSGLDTFTTVEFNKNLEKDEIEIENLKSKSEIERVRLHLERIRKATNTWVFARVKSKNTFPKGTGLSSSGSGFAALTYAALASLGVALSEKEISILARQASGTACRCVCAGFVEWESGTSSNNSYARTIFPPDYWDLRDVVVVLSDDMKAVSSTKGHALSKTSPFFQERQNHINSKIERIKKYIEERDFTRFGELIESEALEFHSILLTSQPPIVAWYPGTLEVIHAVLELRRQGIEAYYTINTGFNVHVITQPQDEQKVMTYILNLPLVRDVMVARPGGKPNAVDSHLF